jgi:hypothetical protein
VVTLPDCPLCYREVDSDGDQFRCYICGASWDYNGAGSDDGEWDDDYDERGQCEATNGDEGPRCVLTEDHEREHRDIDGKAWAGKPYKVWGYRKVGTNFVSPVDDERTARSLAKTLGSDYEPVWRMSNRKAPYTWVLATANEDGSR